MTSGTSYSPPPAFGRFKLLHQIGAGVLGPVFRTHDPEHERLVAVKAFTLDLTPEQAAALAAELKRLAAIGIDAPYIAAPIAAGIEEFAPYLAAPFVPGESLDAAIRQYGPAPAGDAMRLIAHVAEALDAASLAGVYHGSLHPRDIIVTPGDTHVTGLGVAQALGRAGLHGPVRRPYVAPEREGGDDWGAPADVYALAAIAYEVLTGRRALPGTEQPLPGLADLHVHDLAMLRDVLEAAFDPDPGRRPARARDFAAAVAAALTEGAPGVAPADRASDKRPRKPKTRPHKLPGLDEPLAAADAPVKPKSRTPAVVRPPREDRPEAVAAPAVTPAPGLAPAGPGEIRYVPVTDPADAGGSALDLSAVSASLDELSIESDRAQAPDAEPPAAAMPEVRLASGLTPDLRLADELLSRTEAAGESVDADLAAALDRMASQQVAAPTPALIGIDVLGPGPDPSPATEDIALAAADVDLAAETPVGYRPPSFLEPLAGLSPAEPTGPKPVEPPAAEVLRVLPPPDVEELSLAFDDRPGVPVTPSAPRSPEPDLAAVDASLPPLEPFEEAPVLGGVAAGAPVSSPAASPEADEPPRPFVRGRVGDRRRPPSRYSRIDLTPPPDGNETAGDDEVPRAFEPSRSAPPLRSTPDFELLARSAPARPAVMPVVVGVVAGLILGVAGGYWLGARSSTAGAPAASAAVTRVPPPAGPPPGSAASAPASTAPASAAASVQGSSPVPAQPESPSIPPSDPTGAASRSGTEAAGPEAVPAGRPPARAVRGSIQVTASQQANVYVDGERRGLTPRGLRSVPLGSHTVRVTRPGYEPQEQTVVLTAEEPAAAVSFTLRRSGSRPAAGSGRQAPAGKSVLTVVIESTPPGARIRIDGRDLAATPLTVRQLRPGTHTLELRLPGYKTWTQRLTVAAGDDRRITATLERDIPR